MATPSPGARRFIASLALAAATARQSIGLDSGPLIDYVARQEPVASLLEPIMADAAISVIISTITLAEVIARPAMLGDRARLDAIVDGLRSLPGLDIIALDQRHAIETSIVRGETMLRLPDAAIVATARLAGAIALLGNDRKWRTRPLGVAYHHLDDILSLS